MDPSFHLDSEEGAQHKFVLQRPSITKTLSIQDRRFYSETIVEKISVKRQLGLWFSPCQKAWITTLSVRGNNCVYCGGSC